MEDSLVSYWDLSLENQELIIKKTIKHPLVLAYPLNQAYQKKFLKDYLNYLEKQGIEVFEDLYLAYAQLVAQPEDTDVDCFKHYSIIDEFNDKTTFISLAEDIHLISDGTTGLRTWQASLALAEWCLINKDVLSKKKFLELGSGIGLTGLVVSLHCQPKTYIFSDCHSSVLDALAKNIIVNCKELMHAFEKETINNRLILEKRLENGPKISVLKLPWEEIDESVCDKLGKLDFILAADIVYDSSLFGALIKGLRCLYLNCKVEEVVFACTERNPDTLSCFLQELGKELQLCSLKQNCCLKK
ncbi:protein-lysine N-methyltransferase EEF2KMT-like [Euwallacea similis]|uniref:protein-lysine N-methyltransferase EEF2KMT-like n=1 Tax=Euwallacea similis TaxID=1736056 RepID=UPI00344E504D